MKEMFPEYDENTIVVDNKVSDKDLLTQEVLKQLVMSTYVHTVIEFDE